MKILFLCVANSARSQIAEGLARAILGNKAEVASAGSNPSGQVNPLAVSALAEVGIDISHHESKSIAQLEKSFLERLDFVITLCAEEICPVFLHGKAKRLQWPFPDPAVDLGSPEEQFGKFREVTKGIKSTLEDFKVEYALSR